MKKALLTLVLLAVIGGSAYAYFRFKTTAPKFTVATSAVTRGDVVDTVGATGTLQAVTTVQVGTQVSGTILSLGADFNSLVKKGQVIARLDPSLFQTQIEQARANLIRAQADLERLRVGLDDARTKLTRAKELSNRQLLPKSDLDTAEINVRSAEAQLRSSEAQVTQAQASLNQNEVNLAHTVIEAPIDGLVISRNVDVGQTVAASMQAPTLFVLAADLTKMQVVANLDESDVGRIRPKQRVTFRVDAYAAETFTGSVSQVRLNPIIQQNVVTYATVIDVPNNELKLKPGMTANVNVEIARSTNVLRIPNSALRFRPTNDMYAALGQTPPDPAAARAELGGGGGRRGGPGAATPAETAPTAGAPPATTAPATAPSQPALAARAPKTDGPASPSRGEGDLPPATGADANAGGGRGGFGGGRGGGFAGREDFQARMQNMTPEQREQMQQRRRARGSDPSAPGATGAVPERGRGAAPGGTGRGRQATPPKPAAGATTIDALFGALPRTETPGRVWLYTDKQLHPLRVRVGISDGQVSELIEGDLEQGAELVTNVSTGAETRPAATQGFPFGQPGRGGPGGFPGGGGFGGGGNRGGGGR